MNAEQTIEMPKPVADSAEYWLGQIRAIAQMERGGVLTKAQMATQVQAVLKRFESHECQVHYRSIAMLKPNP